LLHQIDGGRSEQQEVAGAIAGTTAIVDDASQRFEECRSAVNFVDDDEFASLRTQVCIRIVESSPVGRALQVEVDRGCFSL
jgi:uncharacterized protein (DUF1499 family)